jgi:hypothetical protein
MTIDELANLLSVLDSQTSSVYQEIDAQLLAAAENISVVQFGRLCHGQTTQQDKEGNQSSRLPKFFEAMETKVSDWLNEGRISLDDMASILGAYQGSNISSAPELLVELENYTIKNFQRLSSNQAANIIINHNKKM